MIKKKYLIEQVKKEVDMPFNAKLKAEVMEYCNNDLPDFYYYNELYDFIKDEKLQERIKTEHKAIRFAYKLYEGIEATGDNQIFQIRNQILGYATIYEAVIDYVLTTHYSDSIEFKDLINYKQLKEFNGLTLDKKAELKSLSGHDDIKLMYSKDVKKDYRTIHFEDKCSTAAKLGLIHSFIDENGKSIDLVAEIKEIYSYRNGIHLIAEQAKNIQYEIDFSKKSFYYLKPFLTQIKDKLIKDSLF